MSSPWRRSFLKAWCSMTRNYVCVQTKGQKIETRWRGYVLRQLVYLFSIMMSVIKVHEVNNNQFRDWRISTASKLWRQKSLIYLSLITVFCSFCALLSSPGGGLRWKLFLSIRSDLLPWLPRQVCPWPCLLLDHPGPWILRHPLQLHLLWHLRPDGHGGATGRQHQPGGGALRLAQPATGAGERHRRLRHTVLLLRPHQPGPGIRSALPG